MSQTNGKYGSGVPHAEALAWIKHAVEKKKQGDMQAAIGFFNRAMQCDPTWDEPALMLAECLEQSGQILLAVSVYQHIISHTPQHWCRKRLDVLRATKEANLLANVMFEKGVESFRAQDYKAAEALFMNVLAVRPNSSEALANIAVIAMNRQLYEKAAELLEKVVEIDPKNPSHLNNLAAAYAKLQRREEAISYHRMALEIEPQNVAALSGMGRSLRLLQKEQEALECFEKVVELEPDRIDFMSEYHHLSRQLLMWDKDQELVERMSKIAECEGQHLAPFMAALYIKPDLQRISTSRYLKKTHPKTVGWSAGPLPADSREDKRLRIGYLSSDYHKNATVFLIAEMFERHDRNKFEIFAYSGGKEYDGPERDRVVGAVDCFRNVFSYTDEQAVHQLKLDGIDILVDLKGYTANHRMNIAFLRPAPITVHYLGYPGTLGDGGVDYFITDSVCSPQWADEHFAEKLVRLPGSYQVNDTKRPLPMPFARNTYGLPENCLVFGNFNQSYKITAQLFEVWLRVLKNVPQSVLWLYDYSQKSVDKLRKLAQQSGVDPQRLIGAGHAEQKEHLSRYAHMDLVLDTFPVTGHTTTSDALWGGAPVLSMIGDNFASRVSASLLHAVGMPELVVESLEEYEEKAIEMLNNPQILAEYKRYLNEKRFTLPLFDVAATTRHIEAAYERMAERQRQNLPPESFSV